MSVLMDSGVKYFRPMSRWTMRSKLSCASAVLPAEAPTMGAMPKIIARLSTSATALDAPFRTAFFIFFSSLAKQLPRKAGFRRHRRYWGLAANHQVSLRRTRRKGTYFWIV